MKRLSGRIVAITGASGFIGTHLLQRLREEGCARLVVVGRAVQTLRDIEHIETDLAEITAEHWRRAKVDSVDVVFHLAGRVLKATTDDFPGQMYRDNLAATARLLSSLPATRRFVFSSTLDVYGRGEGLVLDESAPLAPGNFYAASKIFAEEMIREWAHLPGRSCAILRYGHIYGPGEEAYAKLIPQAIRSLKRGQPPVLWGDGSSLRDYLYVTDAVEATIRAAVGEFSLTPINVVRGQSVPIRDVVECLCSFTEKIRPRYEPNRPNGHSLRFSRQRLSALVGEWPLVDLAEGLKAEWNGFRI